MGEIFNEERSIQNSILMIEWAKKNNAKVEMIKLNLLRITRKHSIVDVFTGKNTYHNVVRDTYGDILVDIPNFLDKYLLGIGIPPKVITPAKHGKPVRYIPSDVDDIEYVMKKAGRMERAPRRKWDRWT